MRGAAAVLLVATACGDVERAVVVEATRAPDKVAGTLAIGTERVALHACRPGHTERVFLELDTGRGVFRFENATLSWNGIPLTCEKLDRSWGGGIRRDGSAYWRGTLAFRCTTAETDIVGDLDLDCGGITAEERAQLDANRRRVP